MQYQTMLQIEEKLNKYSSEYEIKNVEALNVFISAHLFEENKELFLNELDLILPLGLIFTHEYENGRLKIIFKEVQ